MLEVKNVSKRFGQTQAVDHVSFQVREGKIFGLLGRNGAGKSTIFRMILGIIPAEEGSIYYNGQPIQEKIADEIGYLPEEGSLILSYTVLEQCLYYGALKSMTDAQIKESLLYWLQRFHIVEYMNKKIKDLSKGNRQKIQFIIALLHRPKLLVLDEPFSGLDPISVEEIKKVILELKEQNTMIVFSSHRMDQVEMLCEDILMIDQGKEILKGEIAQIKQQYGRQKIEVVGDISEDILKTLEHSDIIWKIEKQAEHIYYFTLANSAKMTAILQQLGNSEIEKISVMEVSLNDIFLDKVGQNDEE